MNMCRGKFRSKPWDAILEEARILVAQGAKELNLIAEDTNQWGMDRRDGLGLAQLLRELGKLKGLRWMRLLYCYPSYFTEELIDEIANNPKVGPCRNVCKKPATHRVPLHLKMKYLLPVVTRSKVKIYIFHSPCLTALKGYIF